MHSTLVLFLGSGIHRKARLCRDSLLRKARETIANVGFDVASLGSELTIVAGRPSAIPKISGGWGDIRDHQLCVSMTLWGT